MLALMELTSHYEQGKFLQIEQIVASQQIPDRYLAQLLMTLRRGGFVRSQRGAKGGYLLTKAPRQITVLEVLACLEGSWKHGHLSQTEFQTADNSAIEQVWQEAVGAAKAVLGRYTLQDLCDKRDEGQELNPMYYI